MTGYWIAVVLTSWIVGSPFVSLWLSVQVAANQPAP